MTLTRTPMREHRAHLTAHFSRQTLNPTSTQAVLAVSLDIISHTIQHALTTHPFTTSVHSKAIR